MTLTIATGDDFKIKPGDLIFQHDILTFMVLEHCKIKVSFAVYIGTKWCKVVDYRFGDGKLSETHLQLQPHTTWTIVRAGKEIWKGWHPKHPK